MTQETEDVVRELRSWPAVTQGDALSASTVALLMEKAADLIERLSDRIDVLNRALGEARDELRRQHRGVDFDRERRCRSVLDGIDAALRITYREVNDATG